MSRENVELVRRMAQAWNERGWQGVVDDGLLDPDVEYHDDQDWPEARSTHGEQALVERFDEIMEAIGKRGHAEVKRTVAHGSHVALVFQLSGEGTTSDVPYAHSWGFLCRVKGDRIDYIQAYLSAEEALEAASLSE
jgi:ketosteroid isomerase-like protein